MATFGNFDVVFGASLYGWAFDDTCPAEHISVEAVADDGRVLGTSKAELFRGDLLIAGCGIGGMCAFKIDLTGDLSKLIGVAVSVRRAGTAEYFAGSPRLIELNANLLELLTRTRRAKPILAALRDRLSREARGALSIIMPVHDTPQKWLVEALESVRNQWCGHWELICVDDASTAPHVGRILAAYARSDPRFRVVKMKSNVGIAAATNFGIRAARHAYIAFMDHDDYLEPHAVWRMLRAIHKTDADLLYSDEVLTSESISHFLDARMRPAFSYDYYISHPYFVHFLCVRRDLACAVGGWTETMSISADVDFVLRVLERARLVAHVPSILYRWRTHATSTGHAASKAVMATTIAAVQRHLKRLGTSAIATEGPSFNQFRVNWHIPRGRTLIVVPTKNGVDLLRKCVTAIERTTKADSYRLVVIDHQSDDPRTRRYLRSIARRHIVTSYEGPFNFSRMNNLAVRMHGQGCRFVLFMNNDVEAISSGWLERLASLAARRNVGAVGPALLFPDRRIQHAGVVIGYDGAAEHVGKFMPFEDADGSRTLGANSTLTSVRDFSAVTAACLMMRLAAFRRAGGFREDFAVAFNDTDLCLRLSERGLHVLYDGYTALYHHESATRARTNDLVHPEDTARFQGAWRHLMRGADPFYNPALSLTVQDHILRAERVVSPAEPRVVATDLCRPRNKRSADPRVVLPWSAIEPDGNFAAQAIERTRRQLRNGSADRA